MSLEDDLIRFDVSWASMFGHFSPYVFHDPRDAACASRGKANLVDGCTLLFRSSEVAAEDNYHNRGIASSHTNTDACNRSVRQPCTELGSMRAMTHAFGIVSRKNGLNYHKNLLVVVTAASAVLLIV